MKFSTQTIESIKQLLGDEFRQQSRQEEISADEIEHALRDTLQEIGQGSFGEMLSIMDENRYQVEERCTCQQMGKRVSRREAQLLSVYGRVTYKRSYYCCSGCGKRWVPLDQRCDLRPGRATRLMTSLLGIAGVSVSFEEARQQIKHYLQVEVSANTIRQATQWIGERQAEREENWEECAQDLAYLQQREQEPERPERLYGSMDGAFVPVEKEWKEAKMVSWYQMGKRYGREELHAREISYYPSMAEAAPFSELVWATAVQHQADRAQELIFICDGAAWIWKIVEQYFPHAVQIVDWFHACEYLYPVAENLFSDEDHQKDWISEMKALVWEGQVETVIQTCQKIRGPVAEPIHRLITYYGNNLERMRYADFRQENYFIGSGTIESGCKQVVSMRLKRSGATWSLSGASATAKARAAWLSGSWNTLLQLPLAA